MSQPDWATAALKLEIAMSVAYGGKATVYEAFTHIHNSRIPWAGDFNRTISAIRALGISCCKVVNAYGPFTNAPAFKHVSVTPLSGVFSMKKTALIGTAVVRIGQSSAVLPACGVLYYH